MDNLIYLKQHLREVPNFPKPGINFYDVSTLFKDNESLNIIIDDLYNIYKDKGITKIVGIESRGFVIGSLLAYKLGAGFVMCRKPGKLPADTISETYNKEYGSDTIEIHTDAINSDDVVLIHDDVLATGGTALAAKRLVSKFNPKEIYLDFLIEIDGLYQKDEFDNIDKIHCLMTL